MHNYPRTRKPPKALDNVGTMHPLARAIFERLRGRNLTDEAIARISGYSVHTIRAYRRGVRPSGSQGYKLQPLIDLASMVDLDMRLFDRGTGQQIAPKEQP